MKKILCFALLFTLLFTSCKLLMQEDYGTVIIDLEGKGERAVGANGLPELSSASMKIEIIDSRGGSLVKYLEENEAKVFHGNFIVGSELTVRVSLFTGSAVWVGNAGLTVAEGNNTVNLKLSKNAVFFKPFGFSVIKKGSSATYDITMPEGTIKITGASLGSTDNPEFCRDGKARLYVAYKTSSAPANWKLERYNSDGSGKKEITLPSVLSTNYTVKLAYDIKKGKTYLYCTDGSSNKFYPIGEDTVLSEINGGTLQGAYIAVYNGYLFTVKTNELYMYKINGSSLSSVGSQKSLPGVKIAGSNKPVNCRDVFIKDNKIYILFTLSSITGSPYYSLGGIIEYAYTEEGIEDRPPHQYGFTDGLAPENNIIHTPENDFYGAVQVLGFEDDNIYIADEGFNNFNTSPLTYSHVNRLAVFNTVTGNLSFKSTDYKWFLEAAAQAPVPGGKVLLLAKNTDTDKGFVYYQKNEGDYNGLTQPLIFSDDINEVPTDVFCCDINTSAPDDDISRYLYIVWKVNNKYIIRGYLWLKNSLEYSNSFYEKDTLLNKPITAIAVCTSNSDRYLYYTYKDGSGTHIKRLKWAASVTFASASNDINYTVNIDDRGGSKSFCTALAANKDGVFAAIKSVDNEATPTTYSADIRKYKHAGTSFYDGERSYISESIPSLSVDDFRLAEISDMQVKNDILYGVSVKKTGKLNNSGTTRVFTSGKLFKIENLSSAFNSSTTIIDLWNGGTETEGFAPYRIISGSENKLIIASDGYYGNKNLSPKVQNKNKVLNFSYPYNTPDVKDTEAKFSKELSLSVNEFDWK
ncbi:hypothetical protein [Treponema pedis]|uniref:hypothetical protein n=1 Tax=Treponema pedis TaxID=409322 RepID=UPI0003F73EC2|nr:hypothetical protein [Treponema pedis]